MSRKWQICAGSTPGVDERSAAPAHPRDARRPARFRRLAVFDGGSDLATAEALTGHDDTAANGGFDGIAFDGIASLVEQSLLQQVPGPDGAPRYVMLETIRDYALH